MRSRRWTATVCPTSTGFLRARTLLARHVRSPLHRPRVQEALLTGQLLGPSYATCAFIFEVVHCQGKSYRVIQLECVLKPWSHLAAHAGRECTAILSTGCHVRHAVRMPTARWGQTRIGPRASATPDSMAMQPRPAAGVTSVLPTRPQLWAPVTIHLSRIAIATRDTTATQEP